ncbi:ankyrin repeat domain-containing protein [Shewanella intestini]|uniref:Ankyrin repeat domain-containing protein n=1 Tax=Shewanella intestini TaxID=2017544 RepID=A0ABS5I351_9GAMM|nr:MULTISPECIES: ankyrin repeat domain-containing protein [Shewanella]MBR9728453.1 ankyrin repeat domain-containing protein [Shewanella intestini]MRG36272.1 ankyrin repeat domain-containing protein [Shewanella sp. XMDDZSB0408]
MRFPPLHQAIISNDYERFIQLIEQDNDVNQLDALMGNAPLHIAAQQRSEKWALVLIAAGAFINLQTPKHGVTPLMVGVWHRKPSVVKLLLEQPLVNTEVISTFGLKALDLVDFGASQKDEFGQTQANELQQLFARYFNQREALESSLTAYQIVTESKNDDEQKAAQLKALSEWSSLNTPSPVTASGNDEHTAVMVAARDDLTHSLRILMEHGGNQTTPDHYMKAIPLHKAAYNGRTDVIRLLADYPGFSETLNTQGPNNGYTPLHDAVWHGHVEAAKALVEAGCDTELKAFDGQTPLDLAKEYHYQDIIDFLERK